MKNQINQSAIELKEVELRDVCEVKKGNSITKNTITEGNIPVIVGGQQPAYYHNASNRTGETLTVSGSGSYSGFVAYFSIPIFASDCSTIQVKDKQNISTKYVYLFLKSKQDSIYKLQKGIAQPHVYPKDLEIIKIPLPFRNGHPDLETQKAIVSILEKAEQLKEKRKQSIKLLDEYVKSVFNEMFMGKDFDEKRLEEVSDIIMGQSPPGESYNENGKGIPFFQGKSEFTEKYPIIKKWTTESSKIAEPNSILMSVRAPVGDVNLCNISCCIGRGLASIKPRDEIELLYVFYVLKVM